MWYRQKSQYGWTVVVYTRLLKESIYKSYLPAAATSPGRRHPHPSCPSSRANLHLNGGVGAPKMLLNGHTPAPPSPF